MCLLPADGTADDDERVPTTLDDSARRLLDGRNFATVATLGPDGHPHSSVVWVDRDGDTVVFSLTADKQKARNLARDPRVSLSVFDLDNPYHSVEIRGTAELVEDPERSLPERLSRKYLGQSPPPEPAQIVRLVARISPTRVNGFSASTS
jgi:PPOX class probable F420-dependent enzyme